MRSVLISISVPRSSSWSQNARVGDLLRGNHTIPQLLVGVLTHFIVSGDHQTFWSHFLQKLSIFIENDIVPLYRLEPGYSFFFFLLCSGTSPWCVDDDDIKWMNVGEIITYLIAIKLRICSWREWRGGGGGNNNCTHHNHVEGRRSSSHPVDVGCCEIIVLTRKQQQCSGWVGSITCRWLSVVCRLTFDVTPRWMHYRHSPHHVQFCISIQYIGRGELLQCSTTCGLAAARWWCLWCCNLLPMSLNWYFVIVDE